MQRRGLQVVRKAVLLEDDGKAHTINLCRNCFDHRLTECSLEGKNQTKGLSRQTVRPLSGQMDSSKECGVIHGQKESGQEATKAFVPLPNIPSMFPSLLPFPPHPLGSGF